MYQLHFRTRFRYLILALLLICFITTNITASGPPALYGKLLLKTSSGTNPLANACVNLLKPGNHKIIGQAYSDSQGYFAFYKIPAGNYELQVLYGKKVLKQQMADKVLKTQVLQYSGRSKPIPDIQLIIE